MLAAALIVFREIVEASLIISIILAATRGIRHRGWWVSLGITGGCMGAVIVAYLTTALSQAFAGTGQEIVNACILFLATGLISWHLIWMNSHGREMAKQMRAHGHSVANGDKHMSTLAVVVALAVMREGSEIVLMLQGLWSTGSANAMMGGAILGLVGGTLMGALMYAGFVAMPIGRVFALTNGLLILIASGMAARGANSLVQANLLPDFGNALWDTSAILSDQSLLGQILAALVGYIAQPSGIEVGFYLGTLIIVGFFMLQSKRPVLKNVAAVLLVAIAATTIALAVKPSTAFALDGKVYSPNIVKGEAELEYAGTDTFDSNRDKNGEQEHQFSLGYTFTDFWKAEVYFAELEGEAGDPTHYAGNEFENVFQLVPTGEYWLDAGVLASYHLAARKQDADSIELKLLFQKDIGPITTMLNVGGEQEVGSHATAGATLSSALNARYRWSPYFEPGVEVQSDYGNWNDRSTFNQQGHYVGPIAYGTIIHNLKYEIGAFAGISQAAASSAMRAKLEYEVYF